MKKLKGKVACITATRIEAMRKEKADRPGRGPAVAPAEYSPESHRFDDDAPELEVP